MRLSVTLVFALSSVAYHSAFARPLQRESYTSLDAAVASEVQHTLVTRDVFVEWPELQASRAYHVEDEYKHLVRRGPVERSQLDPIVTDSNLIPTNAPWPTQQMAAPNPNAQASSFEASQLKGSGTGVGVQTQPQTQPHVTFTDGTYFGNKEHLTGRRPTSPPPAGFRNRVKGWAGKTFGSGIGIGRA